MMLYKRALECWQLSQLSLPHEAGIEITTSQICCCTILWKVNV